MPTLHLVIRLRDRVNRGDVKRAAELRQWLDSYGVTPKGQQDRRWRRPDPPRPLTPFERIRAEEAAAKRGDDRYGHLRGESAASRFERIMGDTPGQADHSRHRTVIVPEDPR